MKRTFLIACSVIALAISFALCRYVLFGLHGMKAWPLYLAITGLVAIIIAAIYRANKVIACVAPGYIVSFCIGLIFKADNLDSGGGITNNMWIIWTATFLILILAGVGVEVIYSSR
jgi:hypothetical protein